ncbi:hypothetical protein Flexsi_1003 [Flexistipes sinusarabici DSM 4947]|uniref:DUF2914 domain-containing protein n=2 Tax=Flexistipes sinusarabici TaxID=2352 RepID=F8E5N1_FLESM|nr:DUF2914 domain-containing protein [Flexistipes sinusarabici]AEI14662.1 hypothetical protein Flexsi_1003 [Flexistipes sinusarabici DSM 4947]HCW94131.1 DUF2914 domain-containing protein [Flexistipes sinusarabici]
MRNKSAPFFRLASIVSLITLVLLIFSTTVFAKTEVLRISIAKDIENLEPVNTGKTFDNNVGKLYCFTEIKTDEYPTKVVHVWLYNDNIIAEVPLEVNSTTWRTYSSKKILPKWAGNWKVEVYSNDGELIDSVEFNIK